MWWKGGSIVVAPKQRKCTIIHSRLLKKGVKVHGCLYHNRSKTCLRIDLDHYNTCTATSLEGKTTITGSCSGAEKGKRYYWCKDPLYFDVTCR